MSVGNACWMGLAANRAAIPGEIVSRTAFGRAPRMVIQEIRRIASLLEHK